MKFTWGDGAMPASRAILAATSSILSTSCRQSKIQKLWMPCFASVRIQSSMIESGVMPMPTTPLERAPARSTEFGSAARTRSRPSHGSSML